jgi:hypothetical protein
MARLGRNLVRAAARPGLSILAGDDHYALPSGKLANPDALQLIGPGATLDLDVLNDEIADGPSRRQRTHLLLAAILEHLEREPAGVAGLLEHVDAEVEPTAEDARQRDNSIGRGQARTVQS